jgi:hypothetical protein
MLYNALIVRQFQSDGTPHLKSSIEKTHAPVKSCKISSTVGIGYLSLITAVLTRRISSSVASPTIWSRYANIFMFIDCENNQFLKK